MEDIVKKNIDEDKYKINIKIIMGSGSPMLDKKDKN